MTQDAKDPPMTPADLLGRLAARIRLPWQEESRNRATATDWLEADHPHAADGADGPRRRATVSASAGFGILVLQVMVLAPARPEDTIDTLCDRARAALVELLGRMPPAYPYSERAAGHVAAARPELLLDGCVPVPRAFLEQVAPHFLRGYDEGRSGKVWCGNLSHTDPRASKAGVCPDCGAVVGGGL